MRNQSSKPKPVQTEWQTKELQQPPNKSEFQTLTKLLQILQPSKKYIMQAAHYSELKQKHTPKNKKNLNLTTEVCCKVHSRNQFQHKNNNNECI
jgi:hypothetical protein